MDIGSFLFGIALGALLHVARRPGTARILARLDAERQGAAEKIALLSQAERQAARRLRLAVRRGAAAEQPVVPRARPDQAGRVPAVGRLGPGAAAQGGGRAGAADPRRAGAGGREAARGREGAHRQPTPVCWSRCKAMARTQQALQAETGQPGEGAARAACARALGRDPAPPRGRDGRHARLLRLPGAGQRRRPRTAGSGPT